MALYILKSKSIIKTGKQGDGNLYSTNIKGRMRLGRNRFASEVSHNVRAWDFDITITRCGRSERPRKGTSYLFMETWLEREGIVRARGCRENHKVSITISWARVLNRFCKGGISRTRGIL